ncbi:TPA: electron transporter RnfC, partial [Vibrio parahaemolyticus]|nr:electron transporter RnfC [Vibrio parahaemolyticus]
AIARAKARKAQQETESQPVAETASQELGEDPKKAAVAAAIARAKARKAQQDANKNNTEENE